MKKKLSNKKQVSDASHTSSKEPLTVASNPLMEQTTKHSSQSMSQNLHSPAETHMHEVRDANHSNDEHAVEALLFASGKYMDEGTLAELCEIDRRKIRNILESLQKTYESRDGALAIFCEGHAWKINVREKYLPLVRKIVSDTELHKSTMETLAVIAWKSPIYQSEVVRIRGNKCYDHIDELEQAGFVTKEKKGRSFVLKTTDKFANYFDIDRKHIQDVLKDVKIPEQKMSEQQATLQQQETIPVNVENKVEAINVMKRIETEEEKQVYRAFLDEMEKKLGEVSQKNTLLDAEIPRRTIATQGTSDISPDPHPSDNPSDIMDINPLSQTSQISDIMPEPKIGEPRKPSMTKKQLEKKFKEDILRVRDKMGKTPQA